MRALAAAPLLLALLAACCERAGGSAAVASAHAQVALMHELGMAPLRAAYPPESGAVPPEALTRGVAHLGRSARTAALLAKLRRREPVTLLVLGGSVTNRHAGCTDALAQCASGVTEGEGACCGLFEAKEPEGHAARGAGWARMFLDWLADTWPPATGRHKLFNAGVVASGNAAEPFLECWLDRLPPRFDLALVETHVQHSHDRQEGVDVALEHLLRALLRHGGGAPGPVVALTPAFNWCHGPRWTVVSEDHVCRAHPALNKTATSLYTPFPATPGFEDVALNLAQYYNLPATSQRNALFTWLASNATNWTLPADTSFDGPHPAPPLQRVIADILVHWWRLITLTHTFFDEAGAENADGAGAAPSAPLPPPVTALPYVTRQCYGQDSGLRALAAPGSSGFEWEDEAAREGTKLGYAATAAGATIAFRVSTMLPAAAAGETPGATPLVGVQLLHTWQQGGAVDVACEGGCACDKTSIDCAAAAFSLPRTHHIRVTPADACTVRVTVARAGRVKVMGITLGASFDGAVPEPTDKAQYVPLMPEVGGA
jgi:hypothetical protein